ncbi:MAG: hypothetical protein RMJ33_06420 [Saprospiraceae bacterium]|nr:hypothetical protein [Saprospiraceae bacterium]
MPNRVFFLFALCLALLANACQTPRHYIERGRPDEAITIALRRLSGKKNKKTTLVKDLELAFAKAQSRDLMLARNLASSGRPEEWERINRLHRQIAARQNRISPLLPLVSKDGYRARFEFVDIAEMENESRRQAAEYLYQRAQTLLEQGRRGDRQAARDAFGALQEIENRYFRHYKDKDDLMREARSLGITYVGFEVVNQSGKILPARFNDRLLAFGVNELDTDWKRFYLKPEPDLALDYRVFFYIDHIDVSPERVSERIYTDEADIEDGWEYVLDERGNVRKDSLGNDLKKPRIVRVRADVVEVLQTKAVRLGGLLDIRDDRGIRLFSRPMTAEVLFENYASTFRGDRRALSKESRARIGNTPMPFPADADMLLQAAERLKPQIRDELRSNRNIW